MTTKLQALATMLVLFALYWLTVSGAFHSIDEEAVFAVSRAIVLDGEATQNALYRAVPYIDQAKIGTDGAFYSKYGIGHALAVVPALVLARLVPGATLGSSAMLVNALATALTGGVLVLLAARLGYQAKTGIAAALLYGVATFAWIYAKTMFSEPLVALLWLLAVYCLSIDINLKNAFWSGVALAAAMAIRPASVLVTPLFALLLLSWLNQAEAKKETEFLPLKTRFHGQTTTIRQLIVRLFAWGIPIAVVGIGLLWFNFVRFGDAFDFGYTESFNGNMVVGLQGFLVSLDRSLFLFAPPLLALFGTVPAFFRQHRRVGVTIGVVSLISLLLYSAWAVFWGGPVWGPRYLLPIVPLLFVLLLPALEKAWNRHRVWQIIFGVLAVAGIAIQIPGVWWNSLPMTQELGQRYPLWLLPPQSEWFDLAWRQMPQGAMVSIILLVLAIAALARPRPALVAVSGVATMIGSMVLLSWLGQTSFGYQWQPIDAELAQVMHDRAAPNDAVILNPAPFQEPIPRLMGWMNQPYPPATLYSILRDPAVPETQTETLEYILSRHERVWLITDGVGQGDVHSTAEQWLVANAVPIETAWHGDTMRLTLVEKQRDLLTEGQDAGVLGNTVALSRWQVSQGNGTVQVYLEWLPLTTDTRDLHTFAQLLTADGQLVVGWDSIPQFGFTPAATWQPNTAVQDSLALLLPPGQTIEGLQLIVGLYDSATGERLRVPTGDDHITLPMSDATAREGQGE